jgi:hypothetical protein
MWRMVASYPSIIDKMDKLDNRKRRRLISDTALRRAATGAVASSWSMISLTSPLGTL